MVCKEVPLSYMKLAPHLILYIVADLKKKSKDFFFPGLVAYICKQFCNHINMNVPVLLLKLCLSWSLYMFFWYSKKKKKEKPVNPLL